MPCQNCGCIKREMVCDGKCSCHTEYFESEVLTEIFGGKGGDL
jgi:hypothetical protein